MATIRIKLTSSLQTFKISAADGDTIALDYTASANKATEFTLDLTAAGSFTLPEATWLNSQPSGSGHYIIRYNYIGTTLYAVNESSIGGGGSATPITTIPAASTAVTLAIGTVCNHVPTAAVTYTLPTPTDTTVTNELTLNVAMTSTTSITFSWGSYAGDTPTFASGETWTFFCSYVMGAWCIYAIKSKGASA